ncbi:MAG: hypothetical protein H6Q68_295 [Firmicutes bacterium]|nr:hypothetical protein [Bacillota bacterium]
MLEIFADLHIHVGKSAGGRWIKIPTSSKLTVRNILTEVIERKGIDIIGIIDALSPLVLDELSKMVDAGELILYSGGGYSYKEKITLILGAEIETKELNGGLGHTLIYLPDIASMQQFSKVMSKFIRNINISSQNAHMTLQKLIDIASGFEAAIVPAHVFTPYKSLYGSCCSRLSHILSDQAITKIAAIEIGLSADSLLADRLEELSKFTLLTNSDAHSLEKIGREYNVISLAEPSFQECIKAFRCLEGRAVKANYGLNPRLGKYHSTSCANCGKNDINIIDSKCRSCGSTKLVKGVADRIEEIADFPVAKHPKHRGTYFYQIPLTFIPGIGKKTLAKLLKNFGTEMNIIHHTSKIELTAVVGEALSNEIIKARSGGATVISGGGGVYGKIVK